jgi:hypothetical protein
MKKLLISLIFLTHLSNYGMNQNIKDGVKAIFTQKLIALSKELELVSEHNLSTTNSNIIKNSLDQTFNSFRNKIKPIFDMNNVQEERLFLTFRKMESRNSFEANFRKAFKNRDFYNENDRNAAITASFELYFEDVYNLFQKLYY